MTSPENPRREMPKFVEALEQAGPVGQIWAEMRYLGGYGFIRIVDSEGGGLLGAKPQRKALRAFYFADDGTIESGTLFFGAKHEYNPQSVARRAEALDKFPLLARYRELTSATDGFVPYTAEPIWRGLFKKALEEAPQRVIATVELTEDQKTGKYGTSLGISPGLFDPSISYEVRDLSLKASSSLLKLMGGVSEEHFKGLRTMDPAMAVARAQMFAIQAVAHSERQAGDFFYPEDRKNLGMTGLSVGLIG